MDRQVLATALACVVPVLGGEKISVSIVRRASVPQTYTMTIPGSSTTNVSGTSNCANIAGTASCSGNATAVQTNRPARTVERQTAAAGLVLLLPDGRIAVVACLDKGVLMPRDCRVPIIDNIQAEFDGDRAKLLWPVSLDGRKAQSETYKVVAIMTKNEYEAATTPK